MRKITLLLVLGMVCVVGGALNAQETEEPEPWVCPEGFEGQELHVFNWTTYIADDTMSNFAELCGVTYTYDTFGSGDELVARLRAGNPGYDIVVPPGTDVARLVEDGLLEPLDLEQIPNFANLTPGLTDPVYDPGNQYSVPYQWGTIGIGYNQTNVGEEITSWEQVFSYPERTVAWLNDGRPMLGVGLLMLGYDPNSTDLDEINEAKEFLVENGDNVFYVADDDGQDRLVQGEADIVVEYMGDIFQIIDECECEDYAYVLPEEGSNVWVDNLAIPVGAQNIPLAHVFIDYILDPQVGADISNFTWYASPNQGAIDLGLIDESLLSSPIIYPDEEAMENLFAILPNVEMEQVYNDTWDEILIALSQ